jgi:outer membrane autotransporter protein
VEKLTSAVADAICGAGGWIQASGTAMNVEGQGATPGYNAETAGFLAGIDAPVNNAGTRLGLAVGYDETYLADSAGGKGQVDTFRAGIFGSQGVGPFMLAGDFLYGHTSTNSQRVTGIGYAKSSADGNIYSGALQADTLVRLGALNFAPQAGLRIAGVSGGGFAENGVLPAFALTGKGGFYTSVQPFVNLDVSSVFYTESNVAITPDAAFGYAYEAGDVGHALIVTAHDGTKFSTDYLKLDPSIAELSAGISAGKGDWSFYARYSAAVTGNWTSQTGEAGLRIRF